MIFSCTAFAGGIISETYGPYNQGTLANDEGLGSVAWTVGTYGTIGVPSGQISNYLKGTNYGFSNPTGSIMKGIEVR